MDLKHDDDEQLVRDMAQLKEVLAHADKNDVVQIVTGVTAPCSC